MFLQTIAAVFEIILWAIGLQAILPGGSHACRFWRIHSHSEWLILSFYFMHLLSIQLCPKCGHFCRRNLHESLTSYVKKVMFITRLGSKTIVDRVNLLPPSYSFSDFPCDLQSAAWQPLHHYKQEAWHTPNGSAFLNNSDLSLEFDVSACDVEPEIFVLEFSPVLDRQFEDRIAPHRIGPC